MFLHQQLFRFFIDGLRIGACEFHVEVVGQDAAGIFDEHVHVALFERVKTDHRAAEVKTLLYLDVAVGFDELAVHIAEYHRLREVAGSHGDLSFAALAQISREGGGGGKQHQQAAERKDGDLPAAALFRGDILYLLGGQQPLGRHRAFQLPKQKVYSECHQRGRNGAEQHEADVL